jgi:hypothetical protein
MNYKYKITSAGTDLERWKEIERVLQEFADLLKVNIHCENPHGKTCPPVTEDGKLHIRFWSVPEGFKRTKIESAFDIHLEDGQNDAAEPTGTGIPVIDPVSGQIVAEVHGGTLYVLFDLPHDGPNVGELMAGIMQQYVALQDAGLKRKLEQEAREREERRKMIEVDPNSSYRCDHWKAFAKRIQEWILGQEIILLPTVLHFCIKDKEIPADPKLHILLGQNHWEIPEAVTDEEGGQKAQYLPGQLYIRVYNLPSCPGDAEFGHTTKLLERTLPQVITDKRKLKKLLEERRKTELERTKAAWIDECSKRFERTLRGTKEAIQKSESLIQEYQRKLVEEIRRLNGQRRKLEQLKRTRPEAEKRYSKEFDKLLEVPHVTRVAVESGKINVFTDTLYIEHDSKRYEMGKYRIEIYTDGGNGGVRMYNLTRRVDGYNSEMHHPHVFPDGRPCLGNIQEAIPQLLGEYEYAVVTILCMQYLQSVNVNDDAGKYIEKWPLATGKEEE